MEISYLGHSAFKIQGKEISIVSDPYNLSKYGFEAKIPKVEADVVTISHDHYDHNYKEGVKGNFICLDSPGEYEIKGAEIIGIDSFHDDKNGAERGHSTIFIYRVDGINLCHLGDLGTALSDDQIEKMDGIDILMVPVGGVYTIDAKGAAKVVAAIEPKIVIPMHFRGAHPKLEPLENFLKEIGKTPKQIDRLKVQKKELPEEMEVMVLKA